MSDGAHVNHRELLLTAEQLARFGTWSMSLETGEASWSDGMYRMLGLEPGSVEPAPEVLLAAVHPGDRERARATLEGAHGNPGGPASKGIGMEYRVVWPDGSVRVIRGRGRTVREGDGWRWFGVEQDITDQRLTERELHAHYAVSQALREWESFEEGVVVLLRRMATALDFSSAALWTWDDKRQQLVCRAVYSDPELEATEWETRTRELTFRRGEGLPGEAWVRGEPIVSPDVARDPRFKRRDVASAAGIRSALVFPAMDADGAVAALSFYSSDRREPSPRLLRTLTGIGRDLGRFLSRRRAQLQPSPLSVRELEVLGLAAEGLSGPQIAERLFVSPSTVKTHFENIYEKLGIGDRAGAVAYALRIGLIS